MPQKRERVFIVGFRSDTEIEWHFPSETNSQEALFWSKWRTGEYWDSHGVAKKEIPEENGARDRAMRITEQPISKPWLTVRDALANLPDPEKQRISSRAHHNHIFQAGARAYPGHTGSPLDEPAKTLKAGVHGVPGGENMLRRPDGLVRYFTVRESARLQTFPDEMIFHGSWTEAMRQLGNAVPCQLAQVVAISVRERLTQIS